MSYERVWTADSPGLVADVKSIAARLGADVSVTRLGETAAGGWVYIEISGNARDVAKLIDALT